MSSTLMAWSDDDDQPTGMKFEPTEEQLMEFLLHKVNGLQPISLSRDLDQVIPTEDLYGQKEPWEIFDDCSWEKKKLFLFTKLKKVGNKKKTCHRFLRNVGKGTWTNKGQKKIVYREAGNVMGYRRCYRYERKKNDGDDDGHGIWLLQEFILPEEVMKNDNVKQEFKDYALCILKKKMTKKEKERMMRSRYAKKTAPLPLSVMDDDDSGCWDFLDDDEIERLPCEDHNNKFEGGGGEEMCAKTPPLPCDHGGGCWDLIDIDELLELPLPPIPDQIQEEDHQNNNNNNNNQFEERCADDLMMMDLFNFDAFPVVSAF